MAVYDSAGPGRKQCPNCQKFCGVRSHECPNCKHTFEQKAPKAPKAPREPKAAKAAPAVVRPYADYRVVIFTPAGKPPVLLGGTSAEEVTKWAEDCAKVSPDVLFHEEALAQWARHSYHISSEEWRTVREHLRVVPGLAREPEHTVFSPE